MHLFVFTAKLTLAYNTATSNTITVAYFTQPTIIIINYVYERLFALSMLFNIYFEYERILYIHEKTKNNTKQWQQIHFPTIQILTLYRYLCIRMIYNVQKYDSQAFVRFRSQNFRINISTKNRTFFYTK